MPNVVRDGGQMWNKDNKLEEVKCVIPDRSYSGVYDAIIRNCQEKGQFDWTTTGKLWVEEIPAVASEELKNKTFEIPTAGTVVVTDDAGMEIFEHEVETGDIWRMGQTKDKHIQDWVKQVVSRARATGAKAVFWLDSARAHDAILISLVKKYLDNHDTKGLDIEFLKPADACTLACNSVREGEDTIACMGKVLSLLIKNLPILKTTKKIFKSLSRELSTSLTFKRDISDEETYESKSQKLLQNIQVKKNEKIAQELESLFDKDKDDDDAAVTDSSCGEPPASPKHVPVETKNDAEVFAYVFNETKNIKIQFVPEDIKEKTITKSFNIDKGTFINVSIENQQQDI